MKPIQSTPSQIGAILTRYCSKHVTTRRQVPFCLFTAPEFARVGLSEKEAKERGIAYRLFKIPMEGVLRARALCETQGFLKALVEKDGDRILGLTGFGVGAGEIMSSVQIAMIAGLSYTALREAILTHPTLVEGLNQLFSSVPSVKQSATADGKPTSRAEAFNVPGDQRRTGT